MYSTKKRSQVSLRGPAVAGRSKTHTRSLALSYESPPTSFFSGGDCTYRKVRQFTYRRPGQVSLRRRNRFRW